MVLYFCLTLIIFVRKRISQFAPEPRFVPFYIGVCVYIVLQSNVCDIRHLFVDHDNYQVSRSGTECLMVSILELVVTKVAVQKVLG
jgi:hypothetical protein